MSKRILNKVAYVTGAASGIGFAVAQRFAKEGAHVFAIDIDARNLNFVAEVSAKYSIKTIVTDIANQKQVAASVDQAMKQKGSIDILVNSAAIFDMQPLEQATETDKQKSWNVNVEGTRIVTKLVSEAMVKKGIQGAIVNIASVSGMGAEASKTVYSSTKAEILNMTKQQALDLGKSGIRVNAVSPGPILTPASFKHAKQINVDIEKFKSGTRTATIVGRMGTPEEVASVVLFLSSSEASYVTGTNFIVDGGYILKSLSNET